MPGPAVLRDILEATGYLLDGTPAPGVRLNQDARANRHGHQLEPDALWHGPSALTVYFKYVEDEPGADLVAAWRREIWNEGFAPLLWVVSPQHVDLYNGFARPLPSGQSDVKQHLLYTFMAIEHELQQLDAIAGRLAMETGQFWLQEKKVDAKTKVDRTLLADLLALERDLLRDQLERPVAQALIGRSIFTQYLIDRGIIDSDQLSRVCGVHTLPEALHDASSAGHLFRWLRDVFNGDMFLGGEDGILAQHYERVAQFLRGTDPESGQMTLFPYRFDVIPVELISSIYEQFAQASTGAADLRRTDGAGNSNEAKQLGVHYTPLPVVALVLDEVTEASSGHETVLDLTCGSGVFLVEALRRLVKRRAGEGEPSRELVRNVLYNQIYGVDISPAAVRVAAFSLYLAALELDPEPKPPEALKFEPLINRTLFEADAWQIGTGSKGTAFADLDGRPRQFDMIVGNPPWTFRGSNGTAQRRERNSSGAPSQPRGESQDFVHRALEFAHDRTRFGIVLSAMPFFSGSSTGIAATQDLVRRLSPVTLVNLSALSSWLFPKAQMPAMVLLARCRHQFPDEITLVNVRWSPSGEKTHMFEISPGDITALRFASWEADPDRVKTAVFGRHRDAMLLDALRSRHNTLEFYLRSLGSDLRDGLIVGRTDTRKHDATALKGLPVLRTEQLRAFSVPNELPLFENERAERPRERTIYRAPVLLVKEVVEVALAGRALTAVADHDLVYTDAYFGASLPPQHRQAAVLLAAITSSALASWFFLLTGAEFGVWKQRLLKRDVARLPVPDLVTLLNRSPASQKLLDLVQRFQQSPPDDEDWRAMDTAVFDLYELDEEDRILVEDGLTRASWQWRGARLASAEPAQTELDLRPYAEAFLTGVDGWLRARNVRHMQAEIFDLPRAAPLRVVRFILKEGSGPATVTTFRPEGELAALLDRIGERMGVKLASAIVGERELRVHSGNEVVVVKPCARRFWMRSAGLHDADAVVAESFSRAAS